MTEPQYDMTEPQYVWEFLPTSRTRFIFLGRAYDLDVHWSTTMKNQGRVIGPSLFHRSLAWVSYTYKEGSLTTPFEPQVHIGVHHMCEMHRLIEENKDRITGEEYETPADR